MTRLQGESTVLAGLGGATAVAGFTVGGESDFRFRNLEHSGETDAVGVSVTMAYDPLGRKIGVTYRLGGDTYAQTYAYDGWRLVQERHANSGDAIAEYIHGPRYVDDVVASLQDTDGDGAFNPTNEMFYHLTDHQYSTLALTDPAGTAVERIGYTPFGWPAFYDGAGLETEGPTTGNPVLYIGRFADYALRLYDYRTRYYDPVHGRFTTPDPLGPWGDPANLGNPYTYLGNNPGSGIDPYGLAGFFEEVTTGVGIWIGRRPAEDLSGLSPRARAKAIGSADAGRTYDAVLDRLEYTMRLRQGTEGYQSELGRELAYSAQDTLDCIRAISGTTASMVGGPIGIMVDLGNCAVDSAQGRRLSAVLGAAGAGFAIHGGIRYALEDLDDMAQWLNRGTHGPGRFVTVPRGMSESAAEFQSRVTNLPIGIEYAVNGVFFDGVVADQAGRVIGLVDAKNGMYATLSANLAKYSHNRVSAGLLQQAERQRAAVGGAIPIVWQTETQASAAALRNVLSMRPSLDITVQVIQE